ncbi:MAG: hypothetical protein SF123_16670 [Chloroflexota bacterium]|nr:hypothetical protein [Chloroflexota bacterium]
MEWTFETLAQARREDYEDILLNHPAPDPQQLAGHVYRGWNDAFITHLTGKKFKKCFWLEGDDLFGCNLVIIYDFKEFRGEWRELNLFGSVPRGGYYQMIDMPGIQIADYERYQQQQLLNYNVARNTGLALPLRVIRDVVALPNPDSHELVLGKAYLQLSRFSLTFVSYFILGMREPLPEGFKV